LGALEEEARIFIFYFLLALASLKEWSEIIKHLVLEHLVEGLVLRKEDVVYLTGIQKISPGIISVRHILTIFSLVKVLFPPSLCDPSVQGGKIGERKELCPTWLKIVVHTSEK
jgi:hypothetical protein